MPARNEFADPLIAFPLAGRSGAAAMALAGALGHASLSTSGGVDWLAAFLDQRVAVGRPNQIRLRNRRGQPAFARAGVCRACQGSWTDVKPRGLDLPRRRLPPRNRPNRG
jgi:hypothetical protein